MRSFPGAERNLDSESSMTEFEAPHTSRSGLSRSHIRDSSQRSTKRIQASPGMVPVASFFEAPTDTS